MLLLRKYKESHTEGKFIFPDDSHCYCLERPDLNNKPFVSCIPEGTYIVRRDHHGRHQFYAVTNVPHRSAIELHGATTVDQLEGCLAPCMELKDGKASNCTEALKMFLEWFGEDSFVLEIRKYNSFKDGKW